ncbi:hypothetical protein C2S52_006817 [Perilla frutescens var. hirtella]|nr:hypothetical protein C2S52_006817 [Perilla frutescens var. hirtella]
MNTDIVNGSNVESINLLDLKVPKVKHECSANIMNELNISEDDDNKSEPLVDENIENFPNVLNVSEDDDNESETLVNEIERRLEVGSLVDNLDNVILLYCEYARCTGFSVRKSDQRYFGRTQDIRWKEFQCSCTGQPDCKSSTGKVATYQKQITRTNCKARLRVSRVRHGPWKVTLFVKVHNHELVPMDQSYLLRSARHLSHAKKSILEAMHSVGIGVSRACKFMETECRGPENVGFTRGAIVANSNIDVDRASLFALKSLITSDPHNILTKNWTTKTSICNWIGVTCDSFHTRVIELNISSMGLEGIIPPEIGNLSSLISLDMNDNLFYGPIPPSIFNMSLLEVLTLKHNGLSSRLPIDMCKYSLRKLRILRISYNMLYGDIPSSLGECSKLELLSLYSNNLGGEVPRELGNLTLLLGLFLGVNNLNGNIPKDIFHLNKLESVWLDSNKLSGPLPREVGILTALGELYLGNNSLTGVIPEEIGCLSNLVALYMESNKFIGHLPLAIFNMKSLQALSLGSNALTGTLPGELFTTNILAIELSNNSFEGSIPVQVERSRNLKYLSLAQNHLSGLIPPTIGNLSQLNTLLLSSNKFIGEIPSSVCNLTSLQFLHLSNNNLVGPIPNCLGVLSKFLQVLHLKENHFHGSIPQTFAKDCALESLDLNNNHLKGMLPQSLANCRKLQVLDVGNNAIQDAFPFWMETLVQLRVLVLRSNKFNGTMLLDPKTNVPFRKLQVLDISQNEFTGSLPNRYLINFRAMINAKENITGINWFRKYEDSIVFILKGSELPVERILTTFITIDMSENRFSGSIPQSIGKLNSLKYLNLSHNSLTGHIPSSLGNVKALESLDLSSNQLTGEIPWQLTTLNFLSTLNLSMNYLVGQIPQSSGQFPTFDNSSYIGSSRLCGFPLSEKCGKFPILTEDESDNSNFIGGFTWQAVFLGYGSGFIIGVGVACFIFEYGRPKWLVELFFHV